ncbi:heat stress transcription factor B-4-like protein [Tanacetum coccineum]|uniref:Heat stress transcription factor B-4-like protein n=1 Tax=Tanacetum coccineum TaxID=301880 RepID=A0ABQ4YDA6_9ASTR
MEVLILYWRKFTIAKEAKDKVYLHSIESRRNLKLYKNDSVMVRARCDGKVHVFTMSQGTGSTGPNHGMEVGLVNLKILVKAVQDQLQRDLELQISMSKTFRAKAKAKREIRGGHVLQYFMIRDYVVELQSTNLNTTVKIAVEKNTDPSLPTRVFQRIYVCFGALTVGFRACRRDMLGLDGAFMKGPFPGQVLAAAGLDSNNGIYPLTYALVEVESKSSWCWFLQCLGDDIDLHSNSNFTFISDRQRVSFQPLELFASAISVKEFESVGRPRKKRKRSKHEDEPFVKDDFLMHVATNAKASGSASRQAQQTEPAVGQDGSGRSGAGAVIGLSVAAAGHGGVGGPGGASVGSQGSTSHIINKKE